LMAASIFVLRRPLPIRLRYHFHHVHFDVSCDPLTLSEKYTERHQCYKFHSESAAIVAAAASPARAAQSVGLDVALDYKAECIA
jgi:hypothetical protein